MEYIIKPVNSKIYVLEQNQNELGRFIYDNVFSCNKATVQITNGPVFRIENISAWRSDFIVKENEKSIFKSRFDWNSDITFSTLEQENNKDYILKAKGFWSDTHSLLDQDKSELLEIKPAYKWKNFSCEYHIKSSEAFQTINHKELLLFSILQGLKTKLMHAAFL
ncbi:hypothetical protein [Flavobacterium sp.]|uniref:hypothetical protein n=1 Tax=Flavobacterium sp. TaxID=239 RepID=UPI003D6C4E7E